MVPLMAGHNNAVVWWAKGKYSKYFCTLLVDYNISVCHLIFSIRVYSILRAGKRTVVRYVLVRMHFMFIRNLLHMLGNLPIIYGCSIFVCYELLFKLITYLTFLFWAIRVTQICLPCLGYSIRSKYTSSLIFQAFLNLSICYSFQLKTMLVLY